MSPWKTIIKTTNTTSSLKKQQKYSSQLQLQSCYFLCPTSIPVAAIHISFPYRKRDRINLYPPVHSFTYDLDYSSILRLKVAEQVNLKPDPPLVSANHRQMVESGISHYIKYLSDTGISVGQYYKFIS